VRRSSGEPFLGTLEMTPAVDLTWRLLGKKFAKRYRTDAPIELLAYYFGASPPSEAKWDSEVRAFLSVELPRSEFRRVWLFNGFTNSLVLVYPALEPRSTP
jgi:hypothetical protein